MSPELQDWVWRAAIGLVIGLVLYAIKDRRRTKLENDLAEETQQPKVRKMGIEALEGQIIAMSKAWDEERNSKDRQLDDLRREHADCRTRIERAEGVAREAQEVARVAQEQMGEMAKQLEGFQQQLARLTEIEVNPNEEQV